jgi:streptogramin lyase
MNVIVVCVVTLASAVPFAAPEEDVQEAHTEADIPGSGYSSDVGFGSLWVITGHRLDRISLTDNAITHVPIMGSQSGLGTVAIGEGAVWISDGHTILYKVDPQREQVVREIKIRGDLDGFARDWGLAAGEGAVWALTGAKELTRYSAESGAEEATIPLPSRSAGGVLVAFGSVWVSGAQNDELYRVDPTTNQIAKTIELGVRPRALAAGEGAVWVFNDGDGTIQRIDGKSGKLVATIKIDTAGVEELAVGGGFVWASTRLGTITQIDPHTNSVRAKFRSKMGELLAIRYGGKSLWISGSSVRRISPPP